VTGLLAHPPTQAELERLYHELAQIGASSVGRLRPWKYRPANREALLVLAAEMLRYDARLLSIVLQLVLQQWASFNPLLLRQQMSAMRWPQALLVVMDFAKVASRDAELRYFRDYLASGWPRVEPVERFFLDAERPGSRMAVRRLGRNLQPYGRWGFFGSERPTVDAVSKRTVGRYDARTRREILSELVRRNDELTLSDYLEAIDHAISRQQALLDLQRSPDLVMRGHGRGARWQKRGKRTTGAQKITRSEHSVTGGGTQRPRPGG
jgi:hypothetical protein